MPCARVSAQYEAILLFCDLEEGSPYLGLITSGSLQVHLGYSQYIAYSETAPAQVSPA